MPSPAPTKSAVKLTLTIGLVSLVLDVFAGTEESAISRSLYTRVGGMLHKVGRKDYDTVTGDTVTADQLLKCIETPDGDLVEISDEEIQSMLIAEAGTCTFIGFIQASNFDYATDKLYQVRPQRVATKKNPHAKPFALILEAMRRTDTLGMLSYVTRGRTRYAAMGPDGSMATLLFDEEVRALRPMPEVEFSEQELSLATALVRGTMLPEPPALHDTDSARIMDYAVTKAKAEAAGETVEIQTHVQTVAPADDLLALLAASVEQKNA